EPHKQGMIVKDPPVCSRCADRPDSLTKLEQHVRTSRKGSESVMPPKRLLDGASSRISLTDPLNPHANKIGAVHQRHRMQPPWMTLLPSNRHAGSTPSDHSTPKQHDSPLLTQGTRYSTPFTTPPQSPM
ncbi:uncharacterized protein A1O5_12750, partial [Cladophialophora psammophila CBS 110553]